MNVYGFIILAVIAIWLILELGRTMLEELSQDLYTVTHQHASYFTRERGTNRYWLQDLRSLLLLFVFSAITIAQCMLVKGTLATILATAYMILAAGAICILATAIWWRGHAVRELRNLEAHAE